MVKIFSVLIVVIILSFVFTGTAFASVNRPAGTCLKGFELHPVMDPTDPMMHTRIGLNADLNGDGLICMQMVTPDYCLITDNYIP